MAMLRQRVVAGTAHFRLVYSVRSPADVYYAQELGRLERACDWLQVALVYTRVAPPQTGRPAGRVSAATSRRRSGCSPTVRASTFAAQRDLWNR